VFKTPFWSQKEGNKIPPIPFGKHPNIRKSGGSGTLDTPLSVVTIDI